MMFHKMFVFTCGSGTMFWPVCQWGWEMLPAPSCPARSDTSVARSCARAAPAGDQWTQCGLYEASSAWSWGCLYCWRFRDQPRLSLKTNTPSTFVILTETLFFFYISMYVLLPFSHFLNLIRPILNVCGLDRRFSTKTFLLLLIILGLYCWNVALK